MAREKIAMSDDELVAFLSGIEWMALGTLDEEGAPVADTVPVLACDGSLYFAVPSGSAAEARLVRDPRCCCCADVFPSYYEIGGATVHGSARRVDAAESVSGELTARARTHGLSEGIVFVLPLLADAFGFDFGKLERR